MMFAAFLKSAIGFGTVFLFGATGETLTEKSGHLNLGTPGIMCIGAVGGYLGESIYIKSLSDISAINGFWAVFIPILFTMLFAGLAGLLYSFMTVSLRCNQNVTGLTITTFGVGFLKFFIESIDNTNFNIASKYFLKALPGAETTGWFGTIFLSHGVLVYLAIIVALLVTFVFNKTRTGLYLRAVGENPATADSTGINVTAYKYVATCLGSAITGLGGLYFLMDYLVGGVGKQIDVFGWLAVALVIFSVWKPSLSIIGSFVFGALYIAPNYLVVNRELFGMVPYIATIVVLIITSVIDRKESQPPAALGMSYFREER